MRALTIFLMLLIGVFIIDQSIKTLFVEGYYSAGSCIDLELHYNKGVAFSMFAFLGEYLKWIQLGVVAILLIIIFKDKYLKAYPFAIGLLMGGALGNLYDRFIHEGVVDYVAWHCGFDFAVFNFADVAIDLGIALIVIQILFTKKTTPSK